MAQGRLQFKMDEFANEWGGGKTGPTVQKNCRKCFAFTGETLEITELLR
jgi:hypothetical protein